MAGVIGKWNNHNIFEHEYDKWRNHEDCSGLIGYGVVYKFHRWLKDNDLIFDDTVDDTYNNLSGARDGNRFDIHDNYVLYGDEGYEISYLYVVNGNLWAVLIQEDSYVGEIEIENV